MKPVLTLLTTPTAETIVKMFEALSGRKATEEEIKGVQRVVAEKRRGARRQGGLMARRHMPSMRSPPGPPMTLGNMRELGVRSLVVAVFQGRSSRR